jgi:hypothetical protein
MKKISRRKGTRHVGAVYRKLHAQLLVVAESRGVEAISAISAYHIYAICMLTVANDRNSAFLYNCLQSASYTTLCF